MRETHKENKIKKGRYIIERILKKTNGITLIALIITVVVMLILAAVAKYEFYVNDMTTPYQTITSTENTVTLAKNIIKFLKI